MDHPLSLYNTLTRKKENFIPLNEPFAGIYVCGPTVYGDAHLGHARPAITFDLLHRYLKHLGYRVRYVRNITDVGHLENDADEGEDKMLKKARLEQLEPMEVAQYYTLRYHANMVALNTHPPSIEPRATGHIMEQIAMIEKIIEHGFGYAVNGSVYFDIEGYSKKNNYGKLSGRILEDLVAGGTGRELDSQSEKRNPNDFALWKKAMPEHIMRWESPWGSGFPGWHIECSAMSAKYLGEPFDIHGGGMDLLFPHHECEIAQSVAATGKEPVKYWVHNNMITINGQKMGKSLGNFITLDEFFTGNHKALTQAFSPMTIRFFMLQAHYRSTLDFSNTALQAAEKGYNKLMQSFSLMSKLKSGETSTIDVKALIARCYESMNDDLNTALMMAELFEAVRYINSIHAGNETITAEDLKFLSKKMNELITDVLGLIPEETSSNGLTDDLMNLIISLRAEAKAKKDFSTSDKLRDELKKINIQIKDDKEGTRWSYEK